MDAAAEAHCKASWLEYKATMEPTWAAEAEAKAHRWTLELAHLHAIGITEHVTAENAEALVAKAKTRAAIDLLEAVANGATA